VSAGHLAANNGREKNLGCIFNTVMSMRVITSSLLDSRFFHDLNMFVKIVLKTKLYDNKPEVAHLHSQNSAASSSTARIRLQNKSSQASADFQHGSDSNYSTLSMFTKIEHLTHASNFGR
jgi:hypothetical protein